MKSFLHEFVQFLVTKLSLGYQILAWVQLQSGKLTYFTVLELFRDNQQGVGVKFISSPSQD